jgi:hypothetical protein
VFPLIRLDMKLTHPSEAQSLPRNNGFREKNVFVKNMYFTPQVTNILCNVLLRLKQHEVLSSNPSMTKKKRIKQR